MYKFFYAAILAVGLSASVSAEELSNQQSLSCSALLCLSSSVGGGLSECQPGLHSYYSITAEKMSDTIRKRKNFLNLCPASKEEGMPELVDAISQGAGRCDANELNRDLVATRVVDTNCRYSESQGTEICDTQIQHRIINKLPDYCKVYINNAYTDIGLHYSGSSIWQPEKEFSRNKSGKWIN